MPHRMEVEITSDRGDGTWTWRAAGARQPKGVVDSSLLPEGSAVGDVVRVEAEMGIDGITITAVLPSKERKRPEPQRLEAVGSPPARAPSAPAARVPRGRRGGEAAGGSDEDGAARGNRAPPRERAGAKEGDRPRQRDQSRGRERPEGPRRSRERGEPARTPSRERRLNVGHRHRSEVLAELPPEQRPIAEQVLRGGLAAVRQAIEAQNAELRSQGRPEVNADPLVEMAEQLLPRLRSAEWRDRAEAVAKAVAKDPDKVSLRDLRLVVAGADAAARDKESRQLAGTLREALERRYQEQRQRWIDDITTALDDGKVVRALRLSAQPPDPGARFPAELAMRLGQAAGQAMAGDTPPERWAAVLEAVAESPVRRSVKPAGLPEGAGDEVLHAARRASGRVPALAPLLGIDMPPPPGPPRPARHRPDGQPNPARRRPLPTSTSDPG